MDIFERKREELLNVLDKNAIDASDLVDSVDRLKTAFIHMNIQILELDRTYQKEIVDAYERLMDQIIKGINVGFPTVSLRFKE